MWNKEAYLSKVSEIENKIELSKEEIKKEAEEIEGMHISLEFLNTKITK